MPASMSRKVSAAFVFALLLGGNLVAFFPAMRASREVRRFCEELRPGTPLVEVRSRADGLRYRVEPIAERFRTLEARQRDLHTALNDWAARCRRNGSKNRVDCPTSSLHPVRRPASRISRASSKLLTSGLVQMTSFPASNAWMMCSACMVSGV